ncbi:MAG: UDP-N-acetylmuramoyl-L-alanine--D-glutamate ligase [Ignavibacteria bacterium]|nr:UDP-N-acetylmuramoyl-L-alanine--D-glutamate ligase [Ignavibacteria bacterium]MBT8381804.1 UDP-N-acetylmuramoyl-L-alanine--D-glutamate ligase [Ignavibacteria bacterium]MBT8392483.1 UDP-N-acetylmuramoyl-L-alanine--D-glutamate ligase [Ignavibacteria bacterium]NNJ52065.1 UDP-N-acetylmuramoyl-L-alanine--D-glutamate ligase [Ignavibacteriaceae bacterium]NNL19886.1 UDP-N-acetylmuramoyl-L-alanine--D-glutamate ligase [Ignavibacteriaceae bacterium]
MEVKGKNISVIGAARSGLGAAKLIKKLGGIPFVSDSGSEAKLLVVKTILDKENIKYEMNGHSEKVYDCSLMVVSPGVPSDAEVLKHAAQREITFVSEVELAYHYCKGKILAITGTNGKTTTTSLCGHVFNTCGATTHIAGNIGMAFSEIVLDVKENEFVALEVSSFQLDLIDKFKPNAALILNITPDHLDRYDNSIQKYAESKQKIYRNQKENDFLILNYDNKTTMEHLKEHKSNSFYFSLNIEQENGCFLSTDDVIFKINNDEKFRCKRTDVNIRGEHNLANAMAVISTAKVFNLNNDGIVNALQTFESVEHRLELVREIDGVKFINDSKATNVDSVWYALKSFEEPLFLILGGQDKGNNYEQIKERVTDKVKKIYAIGSSAEKIFNYFHSLVKVEIKETIDEAVNSAIKEARSGEVVLLSPACASFDMFDNYEHRGKLFKQAVNKL